MRSYDATSAYDGKFTTSGFDLDESIAKDLEFDDIVTFVVTARVVGDNRKETRIGTLKKTNVFKVINCIGLTDELLPNRTDKFDPLLDHEEWTVDEVANVEEVKVDSDERILVRPRRDPVLDRFLDE